MCQGRNGLAYFVLPSVTKKKVDIRLGLAIIAENWIDCEVGENRKTQNWNLRCVYTGGLSLVKTQPKPQLRLPCHPWEALLTNTILFVVTNPIYNIRWRQWRVTLRKCKWAFKKWSSSKIFTGMIWRVDRQTLHYRKINQSRCSKTFFVINDALAF